MMVVAMCRQRPSSRLLRNECTMRPSDNCMPMCGNMLPRPWKNKTLEERDEANEELAQHLVFVHHLCFLLLWFTSLRCYGCCPFYNLLGYAHAAIAATIYMRREKNVICISIPYAKERTEVTICISLSRLYVKNWVHRCILIFTLLTNRL